MNIKRLFCLLLALAMVFTLGACSKEDPEDPDTPDAPDTPGDTGSPGVDGPDAPEEPEGIDYSLFSNGLDDTGYFSGVRAMDIVTLPDYRSMDKPSAAKLTDRAVEDGDFVNIDYVGSIDGVEFQGGSTGGAGTDVIIGVTSYIDDFLQQIIGHTPGENFDIEVTFPENYQSTDLAGKDAVFNITVNYIWDVTDELAATLGYQDKNTLAQYIAAYNESLSDLISSSAPDAVLSACSFGELPQSVLDVMQEKLMLLLEDEASMYGLDADTMAAYRGYESAAAYAEASLEDQVRWSLMIQAIAEKEGIAVTAEDIAAEGAESAVETYGLPFIAFSILNTRVRTLLDSQME